MAIFLIVLVCLLNFGISIWNAYAVGKVWVEVKHHGGWPRIMAWMGAIQSASGFSWCYLILLGFIAYHFDWIDEEQLVLGFNIGYVVLIPGILFSGLFIMLDSWAQAYRQRTIGSIGTAAWNTYAQIHNIHHAIDGFGKAFGSVVNAVGGSGKKSSSKDDNSLGSLLIVLAIVLVALFGGVITTAWIIQRVAGSERLPNQPPSSERGA